MALLESVVVFLVSLTLGAIGIHVGAMFIVDETDFGKAVWTALVGALVLAVVGFFLGGIPFVGPLLALVAWIWVINSQYHGSWVSAILIGFASWITVILVLALLAMVGITGGEAIGIPGV